LPSWKTNCIEDWETKVDAIVQETVNEDMGIISGIPSWVQMYFEKLVEKKQKSVGEIFKNFNLFIYGGVNFEPYRKKIEFSIGKKVDTRETYPASEGFIAYQDSQIEDGLLLLTNNGIFYEFITAESFYHETQERVSLADVKLDTNYAIILNTNAGLYGYNIGDTVKFVSLNPYKIKVTGRIKHFISAFGEHVIGEEVEYAMFKVCEKYGARVVEFTVAPQVNPPEGGLPYHEWLVSFEKEPTDTKSFAGELDLAMQEKNIYYKDLIVGNILQCLKIKVLAPDAFIQYMKTQGKLGGQNKVPRLSNDRKIADALTAL
jgi:acyl-CoA synthetase (AMP-forming)/AMP-acid ligase II